MPRLYVRSPRRYTVFFEERLGLRAYTPDLVEREMNKILVGAVARNNRDARGFFPLEPTLASTLFGPNPTGNVKPSSVSRSRLMLSAISPYDMRSGRRN